LAKGSTTKVVKLAPALYKFWLEEAAGKNGDGNSDLAQIFNLSIPVGT